MFKIESYLHRLHEITYLDISISSLFPLKFQPIQGDCWKFDLKNTKLNFINNKYLITLTQSLTTTSFVKLVTIVNGVRGRLEVVSNYSINTLDKHDMKNITEKRYMSLISHHISSLIFILGTSYSSWSSPLYSRARKGYRRREAVPLRSTSALADITRSATCLLMQ